MPVASSDTKTLVYFGAMGSLASNRKPYNDVKSTTCIDSQRHHAKISYRIASLDMCTRLRCNRSVIAQVRQTKLRFRL